MQVMCVGSMGSTIGEGVMTTKFLWRRRYDRAGLVLTLCSLCARARYCEPHGTTAPCRCTRDGETESTSIPMTFGDAVVMMTASQRRALVAGGATTCA